jgi:hypothetical protein
VETRTTARPFRHRQTKGAETDTPSLTSTAPHSYSTAILATKTADRDPPCPTELEHRDASGASSLQKKVRWVELFAKPINFAAGFDGCRLTLHPSELLLPRPPTTFQVLRLLFHSAYGCNSLSFSVGFNGLVCVTTSSGGWK